MNKSTFLIAGKHAVTEALKNPNRKVLKVFLNEDSKKTIELLNSLLRNFSKPFSNNFFASFNFKILFI